MKKSIKFWVVFKSKTFFFLFFIIICTEIFTNLVSIFFPIF